MKSILLMSSLVVFTGTAVAHGGGLNAEGCHHNRKTGDYHCHRSPTATTAVNAVAGEVGARDKAARASPPSRAPTCHVGPRGGTYTITESGKKNYGGC